MDRTVELFGSDPALLSSLRFALTLDGFTLSQEGKEAASEACLIIDQDFQGDGLAWLASQRALGNRSPVLLLVTHPDRALRASATALGCRLIDKPLTGDELTEALTEIFADRQIA